MFRKIFHTFSSNFVSNIITTVFNYFTARWLGPYYLGLWQTARISVNYTGLLGLGTPFYFTREIPKLYGKGLYDVSEKIRQTIYTYCISMTILIAISLIFYAQYFQSDYNLRIAFYAIFMMILFETFNTLSEFYFKGQSKFVEISKIRYFSTIFIMINLIFLFFWGFYGFLIGQIFLVILTSVYYFIIRDYKMKFSFDIKIFKDAVRVGFPISIEVLVELVFSTMGRLMIAFFLGFVQLGFYSLTSLIVTPINLFVSSISSVLFVETLKKSSKYSKNEYISRNINIPSKTIAFILPYFISALSICLPFLVYTFLPKYEEGIKPSQIFVWGIYFYIMNSFFSNIIISVDKQKFLPLILSISSLLNLMLCSFFLMIKWGITGIALSSAVSYTFHNLLTIYFSHRFYKSVNYLHILFRYYFPLIFSLFLYVLLVSHSFFDNKIAETFLKLIILSVLYFPLLYYGLMNIYKMKKKIITF